MRGTPYVHGDFRGGLNTKAANYLLEDSQCRDCLNVQSTTSGAIVKRSGIVGINIGDLAADAGRSVFAVSSPACFIVATSSTLSSTTGGGSATTLGSGFGSAYWSMVEATAQDGQGPVFLSNGVDSPKAWDGSSLVNWTCDATSTLKAPGASVPNGKYLAMHESRVVIAGDETNPSTLYWSEVQVGVGTLPCNWLIENQQLFDPDDGDVITGVGKVGSNLLVFKRHKIFVVYDLATGANRRLSTNIGCVASRSIVETPEGTFFLSDHGVYVTNGSGVQFVSDQITPTLQAISNKSTASGVFFENHYYLAFPDDPQGDEGVTFTYDYDLVLKSWWRHSISAWDFTVRFNGSTPELYCLNGDVGQVFVPGTYTDFGTAYSWRWAGPWLAPGQARVLYPAVRKRLRALRVDGSGRAVLSVDKDFFESNSPVASQNPDGSVNSMLFALPAATSFGSSSTFFGDYDSSTTPPTLQTSTTFGDVAGIAQARVWGQGVARSWSLTFAGDASDLTSPTSAVIQNYTLYLQERNQ